MSNPHFNFTFNAKVPTAVAEAANALADAIDAATYVDATPEPYPVAGSDQRRTTSGLGSLEKVLNDVFARISVAA